MKRLFITLSFCLISILGMMAQMPSFQELLEMAKAGNVTAQYNLGVSYENGVGVTQSYTEAVKWYRKAADQGLASAQYNLGCCYSKGEGVSQSHSEAAKWWRKAAEQGIAEAQYNLGYSYSKGEGVPQSDTEAAKWWRKAAEQGHPDAQYELGYSYSKGEGVSQSHTEAVKWYRKAAEQGIAEAQYNLACCYLKGKGVTESIPEAVKWWRKAAEQGLPDAQYELGLCYAFGYGVTPSDSEAAKWLRKAAEQGNADAQEILDIKNKRQNWQSSSSDPISISNTSSSSTGTNNDHEWVDLGLSVKWATCNVGATTPEGYGDYFAWGEIKTKNDYSWNTYLDLVNESDTLFYNYATNKMNSPLLIDDAARINWVGSWRLPTVEEQEELMEKCTWTWTTLNGVKGYKVASKSNGNSIFLPAAGEREKGSLDEGGIWGNYWSSLLDECDSRFAQSLRFDSEDVFWHTDYRYLGFPIRAVCPLTNSAVSQGVNFNKIWLEHNVNVNGTIGMKVHVSFVITGMKGRPCGAIAYFDTPKGVGVKDTNGQYCTTDGTVSTALDFNPQYDSTTYSDFTLFIPNSELHLLPGKRTYYTRVFIKGPNGFLGNSEFESFDGDGN